MNKGETNDENRDNLTAINSISFRFKWGAIVKTAADGANEKVTGERIVVPLKNLSHFWWSLEMRLSNWKINLELNWSKSCIMSTVTEDKRFGRIFASLYVAILIFATKDNVKLAKQSCEKFKRSLYWNQLREQ